jgi:dTDP-L-rhamnose 4-epimerase
MVILGSSFSIYGSNYAYRCSVCGSVSNGARKNEDLERGKFEVLCARCGGESAIQPVDESTAPSPLEIYGASKYMQELCFRGFEHCPVHILRFSSVYGKRLRLYDGEATIIAKLAGWIRNGRRPRLLEDGRQIRDWVYVGDIVATILKLVETQPPAVLINVCSGKPTRLGEACRHIARAMGTQCEPEIIGGYRTGDMRHCLGDCTSLRKLIGRIPITLDEGAELAFAETSAASFSAAS